MNFNNLLTTITDTQNHLQHQAMKSVNQALTIRNWLIGFYITEYEQNGEDRAEYGKQLLKHLSAKLISMKIKGMSYRNLRLFRQFYQTYPQIWQSVTAKFDFNDNLLNNLPMNQLQKKYNNTSYSPSPELLIQHFTFTHFVELLRIDAPVKRAFYEIECIRGNWSVRQLHRQIESLLYERTGLSSDKNRMVENIHAQNQKLIIEDTIRDPYVLEFTGLAERPEYSENNLESALLDHIQEFLLELGNGFCFEARQKRITIDNEHDRIDLVLYHRILKCHVLIDLKIRAFRHGDAGQMNFYLNYFKDNMMTETDNPPVGLILCTDKNDTKVKYATGGLENQLFVSKYLTVLPSEQELEQFVRADRERIEINFKNM